MSKKYATLVWVINYLSFTSEHNLYYKHKICKEQQFWEMKEKTFSKGARRNANNSLTSRYISFSLANISFSLANLFAKRTLA